MITVRFTRNQTRGTVRMVMEGHAGAGEPGQDLVCAGATTLAYTLGQTVKFLWEQGKLERRPQVELRNGWGEIIATPREEFAGEVLLLFWGIQVGMFVLARNYPQNLGLTALYIV